MARIDLHIPDLRGANRWVARILTISGAMWMIVAYLTAGALTAVAAVPATEDGLAAETRSLHHPSQSQRLRAGVKIFNRGSEARAALPALFEALKSENDVDVRQMLVNAIRVVGTGQLETIAPLTWSLQHDSEARVRTSAAEALGEIAMQPVVTVPALIDALHDQSAEVRHAAAVALGEKNFAELTKSIVPALIAALGDPDDKVWTQVANTLGDLGAAAAPAVPALREMLKDNSNADHRLWALRALSNVGPVAAAATPECLAALNDQVKVVQVHAAIALLSLGSTSPPAMSTLVGALSTPPSSDPRERADILIPALGTLGNYAVSVPSSALPRIAALTFDERHVREAAQHTFDRLLASIVDAHRFGAIEDLVAAQRIFRGRGNDTVSSMNVVAIDEAVAALERLTPKFLGLPVRTAIAGVLAALAVWLLATAAVLRRRQRAAAGGEAPRVLLSYRRSESAAVCGRVYDRLLTVWSADHVFRDIDSVAPGEAFATCISNFIGNCDAVLVLIGPHWTSDGVGRTRIAEPDDFVRLEIAEALRQQKQVIPVLHDGAQVPAHEQLPDDIKALADRNAIELSDGHFSGDVARLVRVISSTTGDRRRVSSRWTSAFMQKLLVALGGLLSASALWVGWIAPT